MNIIDIINEIAENSRSWISKGEVIDPIDSKNIKAHYADTHLSVGYLLYGDIELAIEIMNSFLDDWNKRCNLPDYHADFNNFAMCIFSEEIKKREIEFDLQNKLDKIILNAKDSHNYTINWLPMRIYTNFYRYQISGECKFLNTCWKLEEIVQEAINSDWTIEDRLPKGVSYNLQYNVSTVAVLLYLFNRGYSFKHISCLSECIASLIDLMAPDGDINYMGRGCNQIFAWGPWIYIVTCIERREIFEITKNYIENNSSFIRNNNILLNNFSGVNKQYWWDYHYCSVYHSHLFMWMLLAEQENKQIKLQVKCLDQLQTFRTYKTSSFQCQIFKGRKEYLSEWGPEINYIWSSKLGMIYKGVFGPWGGHFGNKYVLPTYTLRNKVGLISYKQGYNAFHNRILDRVGIVIKRMPFEKVMHLQAKLSFKEEEGSLIIAFQLPKKMNAYMNFPVFDRIKTSFFQFDVKADGSHLPIYCIGKILNQYGYCYLYESKNAFASNWEVRIIINENTN